YFMEMNTRLQVEHPVTEMITGLDLVEWQLRVAAGEALPKSQPMLAINGHAIEARVYAEDPVRGFLPSVGRIAHWRMPEQGDRVRVDTGFREGDDVTPFYDPLLAKVIAWGEDRDRARDALLRALAACEVTGVATNIGFLERVVAHDAFASAHIDTGLIDAHRDALLALPAGVPRRALIAAAADEYRAVEAAARAVAASSDDLHSPWHLTDAWWNGTAAHHLAFVFDDGEHRHALAIRPLADGWIRMAGEGLAPGARARLVYVDSLAHAGAEAEPGGHLTAPMSGTVVAVMVAVGDAVDKGAALIVLEAMKMEHTIVAPGSGRVAAVHFAVGDRVGEGADLVDVEDVR